jgi:DNA-binding MarR family transcriptional regulator
VSGASNDLIHQPLRLKIMAALNGLPPRESIEFARLRSIVAATDGNLGAHLSTLEQAGYVKMEKDFLDKKPRTRIAMTRDGRKALAQHVAYLRDILDAVAPGPTRKPSKAVAAANREKADQKSIGEISDNIVE